MIQFGYSYFSNGWLFQPPTVLSCLQNLSEKKRKTPPFIKGWMIHFQGFSPTSHPVSCLTEARPRPWTGIGRCGLDFLAKVPKGSMVDVYIYIDIYIYLRIHIYVISIYIYIHIDYEYVMYTYIYIFVFDIWCLWCFCSISFADIC